MAEGLLTTLDLVKGQLAEGLIEETTQAFPEITGRTRIAGQWIQIPNVGAARGIDGTTYNTLVTTEDPTVTFVDINEGSEHSKAVQEERKTECFNMNPRWGVGAVAAKRSKDPLDVIMARQAGPHLRASWRQICKCFYYGRNATFGDAKGFPGLLEGYDSTNMVVDAAGTSDNTCSSVWLIAFGPEFLQWVWGNNVQMQVTDIEARESLDANNKPYTRYHQELFALPGLQFLSKQHAVRIKKLTAETGKTLTDDHIAEAIMKFPVGVYPDVAFMSRRSLRQLQDSRTATNATGSPAPIPQESHNIPIAVTDSIVNTETLAL